VWSETISARGIVEKLCELNISSPQDFNWISQLRYYWVEEHIAVSMVITDLLYGFEYIGNTPRLVITPLTDRCFR
jgi:dynein heavy chain